MTRAYFTWQEAILRSKLEPTTKLVCHTIGCHMAMDGSGCFPSYALIADESGLGRRAVIYHVEKAVEAGYLEVDARQRENGSATSNSYRPCMPEVVHDVHQGSAPDALGGGAPRAPQITTHSSNTPTNQTRGFDNFWEAYPNKVGHKACLSKWKSLGLDAQLPEILAGLERWKASDRWKRGYVADPLTFLNQERWKDIPPAPIVASKPGELRVRETTDAERDDARFNQEIMRLRKLPENLRATDDELAEKARDALRAA